MSFTFETVISSLQQLQATNHYVVNELGQYKSYEQIQATLVIGKNGIFLETKPTKVFEKISAFFLIFSIEEQEALKGSQKRMTPVIAQLRMEERPALSTQALEDAKLALLALRDATKNRKNKVAFQEAASKIEGYLRRPLSIPQTTERNIPSLKGKELSSEPVFFDYGTVETIKHGIRETFLLSEKAKGYQFDYAVINVKRQVVDVQFTHPEKDDICFVIETAGGLKKFMGLEPDQQQQVIDQLILQDPASAISLVEAMDSIPSIS